MIKFGGIQGYFVSIRATGDMVGRLQASHSTMQITKDVRGPGASEGNMLAERDGINILQSTPSYQMHLHRSLSGLLPFRSQVCVHSSS